LLYDEYPVAAVAGVLVVYRTGKREVGISRNKLVFTPDLRGGGIVGLHALPVHFPAVSK
jgi:hypothetical protein